jgi:UDP-3-O-[3-hydroxymyristoyl] glucosamine N-acyltransferase
MNTKFMKFNKVHSLQEIANLLKCESIGDKNFEILGMNEIHVVEKVISFL